MKVAILSYSYTGNNARFATALSTALSAKQIEILPKRAVTTGTIMLDLLLARKPAITFVSASMRGYDLVLVVGPVWMGLPAFPLRRCLDALKDSASDYAFLSISGGSDEGNPSLEKALIRRVGRKPAFVLDQHVVKLLPASPAPTRQEVMAYQLAQSACEAMVQNAVQAITQRYPAIK